jgi:general secretion pathway protein I
MSNHDSKNGFTLLEVVVALAIIAMVLVTLLGTHLMSLNLAHKNQEQMRIAMLARQKLEEIRITPFDSLNNDSGDFSPEYPNFSWEISVEEAEIDNLKNVKLTITSPEKAFILETAIAKAAIE